MKEVADAREKKRQEKSMEKMMGDMKVKEGKAASE